MFQSGIFSYVFVSSCRHTVHGSSCGWCWLRGCCSSEGRKMHRMFTPCCQHTHTYTRTRTQISGDQASSGIWHTEKNDMLGFYKACWEAGSSNSLCLSDVKWLSTEGLLMVVCEIKRTFRELSKLLLNTASNSYSGRRLCHNWCALYVQKQDSNWLALQEALQEDIYHSLVLTAYD